MKMSNLNQLFNVSEGGIYVASYRKEANADNGAINICFTTPAAAVATSGRHQTIKIYPFFCASGADYTGCGLQVSENPTTWSGGTTRSWYNLNRPCGKTTDMLDIADAVGQFAYDGTTSTETVLYEETVGHGNTGGLLLAQLRTPLELKVNEDYAFILTSDKADTTLSLTLIAQQKEN
jgi:hypothetical protein